MAEVLNIVLRFWSLKDIPENGYTYFLCRAIVSGNALQKKEHKIKVRDSIDKVSLLWQIGRLSFVTFASKTELRV